MICLVEGCGKEQQTRGLCRKCYGAAVRALKDGKVHSWAYLEEIGAALPMVDRRHRPRSLFAKFIEKKTKK